MTMVRKDNWEALLNEFLETVFDKPLKPGKHDGVLFVGNAVKAMTGQDFVKDFRGKYSTCEDGHALIKKKGQGNLLAIVDGLLPRVSKSMAQRGDVILLKNKNLALAFGLDALAVGDEGLVRVDRAEWQRAWKVG